MTMARYDATSNYPAAVDDLLCLSDIDLAHLNESNYHNQLAQAQLYTQAGDYLENTATMDCLCASLFNLIEKRIQVTQLHLDSVKHTAWYDEYGVESPFVFGEEPEDKEKTPIWIE